MKIHLYVTPRFGEAIPNILLVSGGGWGGGAHICLCMETRMKNVNPICTSDFV